MIINNNLSAMNAHRQLGINQGAAAKAQEKLSSGLRINRAGDDAAGLSISEKMRAQIRGLDQASRNAQDGISLIQTAEGALDETHSILQRMRELVVQAGSTGTNQDEDLQAIQDEINSLKEEIGGMADGSKGISDRTAFNGKDLLKGATDDAGASVPASFTFQIGANQGQTITIEIGDMSATALGTEGDDGLKISDIDVTKFADPDATDEEGFDTQLAAVENAIKQVSKQRSSLGAAQNRLEHTISNLDNSSENLQAAESRIRDVDMAKEIMEYTKSNILSQASQSMLAQANQAPQQVLQLLG
ncbi:flagellin Hag [Shouchella clausii]|uniref:Flagellin n=2 Tax=Shouchella clausii TaxID=79880 RepID=A0A268S066_SHOCL|nr:flagellin Hag [Shouchella clausii]PAD44022.1 flagellin [Bacillus sp. 7520-S]KKI85107.1 flagellin [Shouchella clausii]MCY1103135.1 flagellin Hag [Shouchella clausii]MEB5478116.1 flagellin Hag [Shouchella clausii]PAD08974.1 flagellin [Shouchella clausii]